MGTLFRSLYFLPKLSFIPTSNIIHQFLTPSHIYLLFRLSHRSLYFIPYTFIPFIRFSTFTLQPFLIFPLFRFHQSFNLSIPPLTPCSYTAFTQPFHTTI